MTFSICVKTVGMKIVVKYRRLYTKLGLNLSLVDKKLDTNNLQAALSDGVLKITVPFHLPKLANELD